MEQTLEKPAVRKHIDGAIEKATDLGDGVLDVIVATGSIDRDGESLLIKGLDTKNYLNNPVVLWGHKYDEPPIGKAVKLTKTKDGQLTARVQFAIDEYPFAHLIYKLWKGGYGAGFSIGFIPKEVEGDTFTKSEMLEFSAVTVPANAEALTLAKTKGVISAAEKELAEKVIEEDVPFDRLSIKKVDTDEDDDKVETKRLKVNLDALQLGHELLHGTVQKMKQELDEFTRLNHTGASRRKRAVRLVEVRKTVQFAQSVSQSLNQELSRSGAVKPRRKRLTKRIQLKGE